MFQTLSSLMIRMIWFCSALASKNMQKSRVGYPDVKYVLQYKLQSRRIRNQFNWN